MIARYVQSKPVKKERKFKSLPLPQHIKISPTLYDKTKSVVGPISFLSKQSRIILAWYIAKSSNLDFAHP